MQMWLPSLLLFLSIGGCAIYPLPEDVAVSSEDVALIVRCQARAAVRGEILRNIEAFAKDDPTAPVYGMETGAETFARLAEQPALFRKLDWSRFTKKLRDAFLFYKDALISYDFTIDTMEANNAGFSLTLLRGLTRGTRQIGLAGQDNRMREVKRHFRIFDTFDSLARLTPEALCARTPSTPDYLYPSAGLTRVDTLIRQFLEQNQNANIVNIDDKVNYNLPQMSDTITFTTKITGNIDPLFTYSAVPNRFVPGSVALNMDNSRQDLHTIVVLVQLPVKGTPPPRFDEIGRITAVGPSRAAAEVGLDRQRERNVQDAIVQLSNTVSQALP